MFALTPDALSERRELPDVPSILQRVDALHQMGRSRPRLAVRGALRAHPRSPHRFTNAAVRIAVGSPYADPRLRGRALAGTHEGRILENLTRLVGQDVGCFAYPMSVATSDEWLRALAAGGWEVTATGGWVTADGIRPPPPLSHLYAYLAASRFIVPLPPPPADPRRRERRTEVPGAHLSADVTTRWQALDSRAFPCATWARLVRRGTALATRVPTRMRASGRQVSSITAAASTAALEMSGETPPVVCFDRRVHHVSLRAALVYDAVRRVSILDGRPAWRSSSTIERREATRRLLEAPVVSRASTGPHTGRAGASFPRSRFAILVVGSRATCSPSSRSRGVWRATAIACGSRLTPCFRDYRRVPRIEFFPLAGDPRELMEYMVMTGGRLIPHHLDQLLEQVPRKRAIMSAILASTWAACTEPDPGRPNAIALHGPMRMIANPPSQGHIHVAEALHAPLHNRVHDAVEPDPRLSASFHPHGSAGDIRDSATVSPTRPSTCSRGSASPTS
jgi:hypothetical protein